MSSSPPRSTDVCKANIGHPDLFLRSGLRVSHTRRKFSVSKLDSFDFSAGTLGAILGCPYAFGGVGIGATSFSFSQYPLFSPTTKRSELADPKTRKNTWNQDISLGDTTVVAKQGEHLSPGHSLRLDFHRSIPVIFPA